MTDQKVCVRACVRACVRVHAYVSVSFGMPKCVDSLKKIKTILKEQMIYQCHKYSHFCSEIENFICKKCETYIIDQ